MLAIELLVEEILRLQNTVMYLQAQLREARKMDEFTKVPHFCKECGHSYQWSADDIAWKYEASPFLPCGHLWKFLREGQSCAQALISRMCASPLVIRYHKDDEIIHTDEHPFCDDPSCGCHDDVELIQEHLERPFDAGLLTSEEYFRVKEGKQL